MYKPLHHTAVFTCSSLLALAFFAGAQEPAVPPTPSAPAVEPGSAQKPSKHSRVPQGFLIHGTVFDDKALSVPGAELRIRRAGEKKYHWNTHTNSRGEFAIRVPPGNDYELLVQVRGFADSTHPVNAKNGLGDENVVVRLDEPAEKRK
jgi:hypothetical protein